MNRADLELRKLIYARFARTGRAYTRAELASDLDQPLSVVDHRLRRLARFHVVVLSAQGEIARALPFCATPTSHRVRAGGVEYFGNCAWDALAIASLLGSSSELSLVCGDCDEALESSGPEGEPSWLVHFAVPAARWWDDIAFT